MTDSISIKQSVDFIQRVRDAIANDLPQVSRYDELTAGLSAIERQLQQRVQGIALRLALIGVSNAGKSSVIRSLLGNGEVVPVAHTSCTGNMILIYVRQATEGHQTRIEQHELQFFTAHEAIRGIQFLIRDLAGQLESSIRRSSHAGETKVPDAVIETGKQLGWQAPDSTIWQAALDWAAELQKHLDGLLKLSLVEITRMAMAWQKCGPLLAGKCVRVSKNVGDRAMLLLPERADATVSSSGIRDLQQLTESDIVCCHNLIREVRLTASVPRSVWDLSSLSVSCLELVDFPGFGAGGSSGRDRFLMTLEREHLKRVHTWITIAPGDDARGFDTTSFICQEDTRRLVYVVNKFDAMKMTREESEWLKKTASEQGEIPAKLLLANISSLSTWYHFLSLATSTDRCAFVAASPEADSARNMGAAELTAAWRSVVARLDDSDAGTRLKAWLSAYVNDPREQGGISSLRSMFVSLANADGQRQIAVEYEDACMAIQKDLDEWLKLYEESPAVKVSEVELVRRALRELCTDLKDFKLPRSLDDVMIHPILLNDAALAGVPRLGASAVSLPEFVRFLARNAVWHRPVWAELLRAAASRNGYVTIPAKIDRPRRGPLLSLDDSEDESSIPSRASELVDDYRTDLCEVLEIAALALQKAIQAIASEFQDRLISRRNGLPVNDKLKKLLSPRRPIDPLTSVPNKIAEQLQEPCKAATRPNSYSSFPFRLRRDEEQRAIIDTLFGWANERQTHSRDAQQHQVYVLRLRQELTDGIVRATFNHLSTVLTQIHLEWTAVLSLVEKELRGYQQQTDRQLSAMLECSLPADGLHSLQLTSLRRSVM